MCKFYRIEVSNTKKKEGYLLIDLMLEYEIPKPQLIIL